jgi:hypothetical protein
MRRNAAKKQAVVALVVAADRMRDHWAEGDGAVRASLWHDLCNATDHAAEVFEVYPL